MGAFDFLSNPRSVQLPDPVAGYGQALTLANLARQNRAGAYQEAEVRRQQEEADAYKQALPALLKAGFSPESVQQAIAADPRIGNMALKDADARAKAMREQRKADADVAKTYSEVDKNSFEVRKKAFNDVGNVAFAASQNPSPNSVNQVLSVAKFYGIDKDLPPPPQDPAQMSEWLKGIGNAALEAKDQLGAETTRRGQDMTQTTAREGHQVTARGQDMTDTRARDFNAIQREAAAAKADTDKWVNDLANGVQINMRTGETRPITTNGQPIAQSGTGKLTEAQGNATAFGMRMKDASKTIEELEASNAVDPAGITVAMAGNRGVTAPVTNFLAGEANPKAQVYKQAQRNWITANLRKESGAAIPDAELENEIVKWFPQMGDKPDVIKSKAESRKVAEQAMGVQAGPGAKNFANSERSSEPAKPKLGEKRDGYIYKGGDPSKPESWGKV